MCNLCSRDLGDMESFLKTGKVGAGGSGQKVAKGGKERKQGPVRRQQGMARCSFCSGALGGEVSAQDHHRRGLPGLLRVCLSL